MFITRKEFERRIKKAKKRGFEKALEKKNIENSLDALNQNIWNQCDRMNATIDLILNRLDKIENKSNNNKTK